jgi:hypothetical protein
MDTDSTAAWKAARDKALAKIGELRDDLNILVQPTATAPDQEHLDYIIKLAAQYRALIMKLAYYDGEVLDIALNLERHVETYESTESN